MPHAESMALPQSLAIGAVALDKQRFRRTFVAALTRSWFFGLFVGGASGMAQIIPAPEVAAIP